MTVATGKPRKPSSVVLRRLSEPSLEFYTYFVELHGGALVPLENGRDYRLDFPPGTRKLPNEEAGLSLRESYLLEYPDGTLVQWHRHLTLNGEQLSRVMLFPFEEPEAELSASCG